VAEQLGVLDTIELIYRAAVEPELWPQALHRFALACGGMGTAMIPITPGDTTGLVLSPELQHQKPDYDRDWKARDPRVRRIFSRRLTEGVVCEPQLFTDAEIARDPMRNEFCRKYGMGSFAAQLVTPMPNLVVAFSVMRALDRGQFERGELETLRLLGTHAARALVVSLRLSAAEHVNVLARESLERMNCAAVVVDRQLKVVHANSAAAGLSGGLSLRDGRLRAASHEHDALLLRLLSRAVSGDALAPADPIVVACPDGCKPLLVHAVPIATAAWSADFGDGPAALVIVVDQDRSQHGPVETELRLLGLTPAEARLAALAGAGLSRSEVADALHLSPATVNDAMKHIYSKLDIARQTELVALVARLALLRSSHTRQ
jgi:DNA-binding CsgD family transcriptional regulator